MTCLCVTRNRRKWLPKAIECFQAQTYQQKEMLIVADGQDVRDLAQGDGVRLIHVEGNSTVGEKRNFGCANAHGEIIAHWDDDDYSAAGRLADQVNRLLESGKACTGYYSMRFTNGSRWWRYTYGYGPIYSLGTALCYRRDWWVTHPFKPIQVEEDVLFVKAAQNAGQILAADAGDLMYATIHDQNTSPRSIRGGFWKEITL